MNTKQLIIKLGMALVTFSSMNLYAKDVFTSEIQVDNQSQVLGYSSISDVADQYDSYNMKAMFPTYTETSFVNAKVNLRDVPVNLSYAQNSSTLTFKIPSLGIERTYTGATREESKDKFLDALKGEDKELLKKLTAEWVKNSPIDPVAGNPTSLLSMMVGSMTDNLSDMASDQMYGLKENSSSNFGMMPRFGRYTQQGHDINVYNLPLTYSHWFESNKTGLVLDLPITVSKTSDGALSGSLNLGVGLNFKLASTESVNWYLMPQIRGGVTGSEDFGTAALIYGGGLSSNAQFPLNENSAVSIINMVSYYKTDSIKVGDFDSGYDLQNTILRNGVEYSRVLHKSVAGSPLIAKLAYARTDFSGDQLFSELSHDFSGSIGFKNKKPKAWIDEYRIGFTYTYADKDLRGFTVNAGYTF
ncbi:hypothetical protein [Acinetobacter wuhouensis]|uniref:Autotransporter domain-containing protein n=1 Tax=Acinetobacter wuhouensis TaxID=1879050 RepID=A0A3G2T1R6_9GAMM|nr:hypothetical protein [Acinetobacter wuhouensis]AYO53696.1 hypothetical protein CDG68_08690 [Acinetobacter wuhouensis]